MVTASSLLVVFVALTGSPMTPVPVTLVHE
jgi:hypothetical protein